MIKLLTATQLRNADEYTIRQKPIASIDLMETAAGAFTETFVRHFPDPGISISVYCGTGNNGGDGLAIARLLKNRGYNELNVKIARYSPGATADFNQNLERLGLTGIPVYELDRADELPQERAEVCIDAILGSGLNRPLKGKYRTLVRFLNKLHLPIVSVDIPTGMPADNVFGANAEMIRAALTITFQTPKLSFFFPDHGEACGRFEAVDIGLDPGFISRQSSGWFLTEHADAAAQVIRRGEFSHKGTYGHALVVAGGVKSMGAALLAAGACVHTGAGLTTAAIPLSGAAAFNTSYPEVQLVDQDKPFAKDTAYHSLAVGPGIGTGKKAQALVKKVLKDHAGKLLIDADGLNILATLPKLLEKLPEGTILTPHVKEFDRLFGKHENWMDRVETARQKAAQHRLVIVLKNRYSFVVMPDKKVWINPAGNPAMSIGGSGDVLSGIIASLLAQGYSSADAVRLGCYLHGYTADRLSKNGMYAIPPSALIKEMPFALGALLNDHIRHYHSSSGNTEKG